MATKLYLHDAAYDVSSGTWPSGEQSSATPNTTWTGATTLRQMDASVGPAQASPSVTQNDGTSAVLHLIRMFASRPLSGAQTVGGGTARLAVADLESNVNANFWINGVNAYVWRPSTGAKVGTIRDFAGTSLGGLEPSSASAEQVTTFTFTTSAVSAADGDVIIIEIWAVFTGSMGVSYTKQFFYDGTTDPGATPTENAAVSDIAAYLNLAETLTFQQPPQTVTPTQVTVAFTAQDPTLVLGTVTATPTQVTAAFTMLAPTLTGVLALTPAEVTAAWSIQDPVVSNVGGGGPPPTRTLRMVRSNWRW